MYVLYVLFLPFCCSDFALSCYDVCYYYSTVLILFRMCVVVFTFVEGVNKVDIYMFLFHGLPAGGGGCGLPRPPRPRGWVSADVYAHRVEYGRCSECAFSFPLFRDVKKHFRFLTECYHGFSPRFGHWRLMFLSSTIYIHYIIPWLYTYL